MGTGVPRHIRKRPATEIKFAPARARYNVAGRTFCGGRTAISEGHSMACQCGTDHASLAGRAPRVLQFPAIYAQRHARGDGARGLFAQRAFV